MPAGGTLGSGIRAGYQYGSPLAWVEIPYIMDSTPFNINRDQVETTVHGTTSYRTYIPGLATVSACELTLRADLENSVHLALSTFEQNQTTLRFRYEIPIEADLSTTEYYVQECDVRVSKYEIETPIDDVKKINVSFQYEGNFTIDQSAPSAFD